MIVCYVQMKQFCKKLFQIGTGKTYAKSSVPRFHCRMNFIVLSQLCYTLFFTPISGGTLVEHFRKSLNFYVFLLNS